MNSWTAHQKNVVALAGLALLAFAVGYAVVIRPMRREVLRLRAGMQEQEKTLGKRNWPLDASRLESLHTENSRQWTRLSKDATAALEMSTAMFDGRISRLFDTPEGFRNDISLLDYKEEFIKIKQELENRGVFLAERELRLGEDSDSPYTYQQMLQVWTTEALINLALNSHLKLAEAESAKADGPRERASRVTVLPVRGYTVAADDKEPFLIEFPVRVTLVGSVENLCKFMQALHGPYSVVTPKNPTSENDGAKDNDSPEAKKSLPPPPPTHNFFPVSALEIRKVLPAVDAAGDQTVEAELVCSSFYRFKNVMPKAKTSGGQRGAPPGA